MAKQEISGSAGIGSSSLIVIFIILCLVTFSVLSLGNAGNDASLSRRNAEAVQEYYRADALAVDFLQKLDLAMAEAAEDGASAAKAVLTGTFADYYRAEDDIFMTDIAMKADQALRVELRPDWEAGTLAVVSWYVYNQEDYEIDQSITVWNGT